MTFLFVVTITSCGKDDDGLIVSSSLSEEDISLSLKIHNDARAQVEAQSLSWSKTLEANALEWAITLAEKDAFYHAPKENRIGQRREPLYVLHGGRIFGNSCRRGINSLV